MPFRTSSKSIGVLPLFNPEEGKSIKEPLGIGSGYWVGAPSVVYDYEKAKFYLYYRIRVPRPGRGVECRISESEDGIHFTDIWQAKKEDFPTDSMERASLIKGLDGRYKLYISYVDPADNKWRTDLTEADSPGEFHLSSRKKIFTASDISAEGVKDPYVVIIGGIYYMFLSYVPTPLELDEDMKEKMHKTADVYNTGLAKSKAALAISKDGLNYTWMGDVMTPSLLGWESYTARICSIGYLPPVFTVFYDGCRGVSENYEERTGIALSWDLKSFQNLTKDGPALMSPNGQGSLRYMDLVQFKDEIFYYYEYTREDGSHELRLNRVRYR